MKNYRSYVLQHGEESMLYRTRIKNKKQHKKVKTKKKRYNNRESMFRFIVPCAQNEIYMNERRKTKKEVDILGKIGRVTYIRSLNVDVLGFSHGTQFITNGFCLKVYKHLKNQKTRFGKIKNFFNKISRTK